MKKAIILIIVSTLIFFSVSFLSFLTQVSPIRKEMVDEMYRFDVGVPFVFYSQFWLKNSNYPNFGWSPIFFIYDFIIILLLTVLVNYVLHVYWTNNSKKVQS